MKGVVKTKNQNSETGKSKIYVKYEKLLADIERQQQFIAKLEEGLQKAYAKINTELSPLEKERHLLIRDYLIRLDELSEEIGVGKFNQEYFHNYMGNELDSLMEYFGYQDEVLSLLHEKYTYTNLDEIAQSDEAIEMAKSMSDLFGFEVNVKEILEKGEKAYFEENKERILDHIKNNGDEFKGKFFETGGDQQKQANNSTEKKQKKSEEAAQFVKDARHIYMRLIKKFHPDLETDHLLKEQKTEIIKEVTKAYQENDFFTLLKLQITYLDENESGAAKIADDMLKRYTRILQKQLKGLDTQINEMHFGSGAIIADFIDKNGKFSPQKFSARRKGIEKETNVIKSILADSKKRPKGWFKEQMSVIKETVQQHMMDDMFDDMFTDMKF